MEMSPATTMSPPPPRPVSGKYPSETQDVRSEIPDWPQAEALEWYAQKKHLRSDSHPAPGEYQQYLSRMGDRDVVSTLSDCSIHYSFMKVFLVDDVLSMQPHWPSVAETVKLLAYLVKPKDKNGMDLFFSTSPRERAAHSKQASVLGERVEQRKLSPQRLSDLPSALEHILDDTLTRMDRYGSSRTSITGFMHRRPKLLVIYILTDGAWPAHCDLFPPINSLVRKMENNNFPTGYVGIQFISFGHDPEGLAKMQSLDDHEDWRKK